MAQFFAPQGPYELEEEGLRRRRKMAELLSQQSLQQPQPNRMAGNMVIKYSPLEGLSQMAKALVAGYADKRVDDQARDLSERRQAERQSTLQRFADTLKGTPAQEAIPEPSEEAGGGPGRAAIPAQRGNPADAYGVLAQSQDPTLQQLGIKGVVDSQKPIVLGHSLVDASGKPIAVDQAYVQEQQLAREAKEEQAKLAREQRMQELQMRLQDSRATAQDRMAMQKELAELQRQTQLTIAQGNQAIRRDMMAQGGKPPAGYRATPDGNLEAIPGGPGDKSNKPVTEAQGKAALYGTRAAQSDKILRDLEDKISVSGLATKQAVSRTPLVGGILGAAGNLMLSGEQQRVEQAQRDFVNAVLRQESGAVISDQEFANAQKQYFPAPGDRPEVLEQKRQNRQLAIDGFERMSGPAGPDVEAVRNAPLIPGNIKDKPTPERRSGDRRTPAGVDPKVWSVMTPEERALWKR